MIALKEFLRAFRYYRRFIYFYAQVTFLLIHLTKQTDVLEVWTKECIKVFNKLKKRLSTALVFVLGSTQPFEAYEDTSNFAIGSVQSQKDDEGNDPLIYFSNRQLSATKNNYLVTEHERLGMIYSFQKYRHYLLDYKVTFHIDHDTLKYIVNKSQLSGRIARWILLL